MCRKAPIGKEIETWSYHLNAWFLPPPTSPLGASGRDVCDVRPVFIFSLFNRYEQYVEEAYVAFLKQKGQAEQVSELATLD